MWKNEIRYSGNSTNEGTFLNDHMMRSTDFVLIFLTKYFSRICPRRGQASERILQYTEWPRSHLTEKKCKHVSVLVFFRLTDFWNKLCLCVCFFLLRKRLANITQSYTEIYIFSRTLRYLWTYDHLADSHRVLPRSVCPGRPSAEGRSYHQPAQPSKWRWLLLLRVSTVCWCHVTDVALRFDVLTTVAVLMVVTSGGLVGRHQHFAQTDCLHLQCWRWKE